MQAQALLAGIDSKILDRDAKLSAIEARALKQGAFVVNHNLALDRAQVCTEISKRMEILESVSLSAMKNGDHYNGMRATLKLAKLIMDSGCTLNQQQIKNSIDSYHYLYSDRVGGLFTSCHDVLWRTFLLAKETDNLLRLFRHSSLIWRLRGDEKTELKYLKSLNQHIDIGTSIQTARTSRELTYFLARAGNVITTTID